MSVYVDNSEIKFGRMVMSHMGADSLPELHLMAERIGLRRRWFQDGRFPHYDVSQSKKREAIALGAIEVTSQELVKIIKYGESQWKRTEVKFDE